MAMFILLSVAKVLLELFCH